MEFVVKKGVIITSLLLRLDYNILGNSEQGKNEGISD